MSLLLLGGVRCDKILSAGEQCGGPGIDGECEAGLVCVAESLESEIAFCEGTYWYLKFSNVIMYLSCSCIVTASLKVPCLISEYYGYCPAVLDGCEIFGCNEESGECVCNTSSNCLASFNFTSLEDCQNSLKGEAEPPVPTLIHSVL